jgi:hypothetical protein
VCERAWGEDGVDGRGAGHGVALWMVGARMVESGRGEDGGICRGVNP